MTLQMRNRFFAAIFLASLLCGLVSASAADNRKQKAAKFEIQLLWGTDADKSPNEAHKPVDPDVGKKLKSLPLKFKNYFLVNKRVVEADVNKTVKEKISEKCAVEITNMSGSKFDFALYSKGKQLYERSQRFPVGEILALGGNAPDSTAWLVVLKRIE